MTYNPSNQPTRVMKKLIIKYDDTITVNEVLGYARVVINQGRISYNIKGEQYCFHTTFRDNIAVSALKPSENTDTLVVYKEQL